MKEFDLTVESTDKFYVFNYFIICVCDERLEDKMIFTRIEHGNIFHLECPKCGKKYNFILPKLCEVGVVEAVE